MHRRSHLRSRRHASRVSPRPGRQPRRASELGDADGVTQIGFGEKLGESSVGARVGGADHVPRPLDDFGMRSNEGWREPSLDDEVGYAFDARAPNDVGAVAPEAGGIQVGGGAGPTSRSTRSGESAAKRTDHPAEREPTERGSVTWSRSMSPTTSLARTSAATARRSGGDEPCPRWSYRTTRYRCSREGICRFHIDQVVPSEFDRTTTGASRGPSIRWAMSSSIVGTSLGDLLLPRPYRDGPRE